MYNKHSGRQPEMTYESLHQRNQDQDLVRRNAGRFEQNAPLSAPNQPDQIPQSEAAAFRERPEQLSNAAVLEIPLDVLLRSLPNRVSKGEHTANEKADDDEFRFR